MFRFYFFFILLGLLFCHQPQAQAQQLLDEAIITANRLPQKQAQTAKVLTILPDSVLRRHDAQTLSQVLNAQTGLWILGANAAAGTNQNVYMRGAGVGYVSILLNGIPVNDPSAPIGNFDLNVIPVAQVERVEILKGAQSVIYGTDAVAGVINIIPRREYAEKWRVWANLAGGSYGNIQSSAGLMGKIKGFQYGVQYAHQAINGFSAAFDSLETNEFERDAMQSQTLNLQVSQQISPKLTLRGIGQYAQYHADLDAAAFKDDEDYTTDNRHLTAGGGIDAQWGGIDWHGNYAFYNTERLYKDDSIDVPPSAYIKFSDASYRAQTHFAELYANKKIGEHVSLLLGGDWRNANTTQKYVSVSDFGVYEEPPISKDSANVAQYSAYSSLLLQDIGGFNAELGARFNHHGLYGGHTTYNAGLSRWIGKSFKLFVSVASGFRAPSLYQLFSAYGNRQLQPETTLHYETGAEWQADKNNLSARLLFFGRNTNDIINTQLIADYPYIRYINQDKQRDYGIETDISLTLHKCSLTLGYAFVTGKVTTLNTLSNTDTTYNNLIRRPQHRLTATGTYYISPKWQLNLRLQVAGQRKDLFFDENTYSTVAKDLNAFALIDVYVAYHINPSIKVFADVRNITNATYFELTGYNTRRFNADLGLSIDFK